ncbi:YqeG family HAD IIIA-type phosphatase [Salinicoccus hispanicus]|uniref:YqeG family HAD IIIA-type phosphatase n=1 Tax=Salinicoccus hispanicus TaxID=157225 RepID=A0A6N8TVX5_9STAP|nr:YqeG family HAD IIIA-type phosphatase [Salinicoccus hispanicus]
MKVLEKYFLPSDYFREFHSITPQYLKDRGIRAVITDLDNTLVGYDEPDANESVLEWFKSMNENDIKVTIVSNGSRNRVGRFCDPHDIEYIFRARKPLGSAYNKAVKMMDEDRGETVMIGDQLMTDVFGANRVGLKSILVLPVKKKDGWATVVNRRIERILMKYFDQKGLIQWGD